MYSLSAGCYEQDNENRNCKSKLPRWNLSFNLKHSNRSKIRSIKRVVIRAHDIHSEFSCANADKCSITWIELARPVAQHSKEEGRESIGPWSSFNFTNDWMPMPDWGVSDDNIDDAVVRHGDALHVDIIGASIYENTGRIDIIRAHISRGRWRNISYFSEVHDIAQCA